jgi:hypothetical protein
MKMQSPQSTHKKRLVGILEWAVGMASITLIVAGFVLTNLPKLSADVSGSSRPNDPMGTIFSLTNEGLLPVYDVKAGCEVMRVDTPPPGNRHLVEPTTFYFPESRVEILSPGHKMTIPCGRAIATKLGNTETLEFHAEMFIVVTYRPKWLLWHKSEKFPMETAKTENGTWTWKSIPR